MFGSLGFTELILILFIVLIIFGAGKLPQLGEGVGKAIRGFKKSVHEGDAIEAEAQGSEIAYPIYCRAKAALDEVDMQCADAREAGRRREEIIRDLGKFALAETEAWLRSHRERPLHPALG